MPKILIIDDDPNIRELYEEEFISEGFDVILAENGAEGIEKIKNELPDIIILDIGMPEKNGLDVLSEVSSISNTVPIIVNTAYPLFKFDFRAHRAVEWIEKSSRFDILKKAVRKHLIL